MLQLDAVTTEKGTIRQRTLSAPIGWPFQALLRVSLLCFLLPLAIYAYSGLFSRYAVDDFKEAHEMQVYGILGYIRDYYLHWFGRYSLLVLDATLGHTFPGQVWYLPVSALFLLCGGLYALVRQISRPPPALLIALLVTSATLEMTPSIGQSLFWKGGNTCYMPGLIWLAWSAAFFLYVSRRSRLRPWHYFGAFALPFVTAGFNEPVTLLQILPYAALTLWSFRCGPLPRGLSLIALAGAALGLMALVLAPGNAHREAYFPHHAPWPALLVHSLRDAGSFVGHYLSFRFPDIFDIADWSGSLPQVLAIVFFAALAAIVGGVGQIDVKRTLGAMGLTILTGCLLIFLCYIPAEYGTSATLVDRAVVTPCFLLAFTAAVCGWLLGQLALQYPITLSRPAVQITLLIAALWLFWNVTLVQARDAQAQIGSMRQYARLWDAQDAVLKADARAGSPVYLTTIADPWQIAGAYSDQNQWVVRGEKDYYHVK